MLSETPGRTEWPGPTIGAHNEEVFGNLLGYSRAEIENLRQSGVI
jgi:crotonobetainyl-CoA:carnitine CoA-transferase CaiB-like acyl-CoA transferase